MQNLKPKNLSLFKKRMLRRSEPNSSKFGNGGKWKVMKRPNIV